MAKVFLSYDRADSDFAEIVQARLNKAGHETFMDFDILNAGVDWRDKLDATIRASHALVVVITPASVASPYVTYEWSFALGAGLRVIPLKHQEATCHPRLDVLQHLDFTDRAARPWDALITEVVKAGERVPQTTIPVAPGAPAVVRIAVAALDSMEQHEREAAIQVLVKSDHASARAALLGALDHPVDDVRIAAAIAYPDRSEPRLLRGIVDALRDWRIWERFPYSFAECVAPIGMPATPQLLALLADERDGMRAAAARGLGAIRDASVVPALIGALTNDPGENVRASAAEALREIGEAQALGPLRAALADPSEAVRESAVKALGVLHDALALTQITQLLQTDVKAVRSAAATALGAIGEAAAVPALAQALCDAEEKDDVREAAARSLGVLHSSQAIDALRAMLAEQQGNSLCYAVAWALARQRDSASLPLIAQRVQGFGSGTLPDDVVEAMAECGEAAVPELIEIMNRHKYSSLQQKAAEVLKRTGSPEAIAAVKKWQRQQER